MKHIVISTVGVSMFTNYVSCSSLENENSDKSISYQLDKLKSKPASEVNLLEKNSDEANILDLVKNFWFHNITYNKGEFNVSNNVEVLPNLRASAEITSILKIYDELIFPSSKQEESVEIQLIASDTAQSVLAACLIKYFFNKHFPDLCPRLTVHFDLIVDYAEGLNLIFDAPNEKLNESRDFNRGIQSLVAMLLENYKAVEKIAVSGKKYRDYITKWKEKSKNCKFYINFSGGYKAITPILTLIAQIEKWPLYYTYDDSDHLIQLGSFPFQFDRTVIDRFYPCYIREWEFNKEELSPEEFQKDEEVENLDELCNYQLFKKRGQIFSRTALGDLLDYYIDRKEFGATKLLGYFLEYKFIEFRREVLGYKDYSKVIHSVDLPKLYEVFEKEKDGNEINKYREFDILLINHDREFIIGEVKSGNQLVERTNDPTNNNVFNTVSKQIQTLFEVDLVPAEFHLYLYFYKNRFEHEQLIMPTLYAIKKMILLKAKGQNKDLEFKAFYTKLDLNVGIGKKTSAWNPYEKLSSALGSPEKIKQIVL